MKVLMPPFFGSRVLSLFFSLSEPLIEELGTLPRFQAEEEFTSSRLEPRAPEIAPGPDPNIES